MTTYMEEKCDNKANKIYMEEKCDNKANKIYKSIINLDAIIPN